MNIPMVDPAGEYRALKAEVDAAVARVFGSGRFVPNSICRSSIPPE